MRSVFSTHSAAGKERERAINFQRSNTQSKTQAKEKTKNELTIVDSPKMQLGFQLTNRPGLELRLCQLNVRPGFIGKKVHHEI